MDCTNKTCRQFTALLASDAPAPGGGGAAALVGAIGTALAGMVGSLTVGKKKYADVEEEIRSLMVRCDRLQTELLDQVEADEKGFLPLAKAYGIPKGEPGREETLEKATLAACSVPLKIMDLCCESIAAAEIMAQKGSRLAVSDAGCAASILRAALESACLNVLINTRSLKDRTAAEDLNGRCLSMLEEYGARADRVFQRVKESFLS